MKEKLTEKRTIILILTFGIIFLSLGLTIRYFENYGITNKKIKESIVGADSIKSKVGTSEETNNTKESNLKTLEEGKITIKYVNTDGEKIAPDDEKNGYLGEEYSIERKEIPGYMKFGQDPIKKTGNYTKENQEVVFEYQEATNAIDVDNENKNVTVKILNDKKLNEYKMKIITKSESGDILTGAGYDVKKGEEQIRSGIGYGSNFVVGTITIGEEGEDIYSIKQIATQDRYKISDENYLVKVIKSLNQETNLYEAQVETTSNNLNVYVTDNNEIIIEVKNEAKEYTNIVLNYEDEDGKEISQKEVYEKEIGSNYSFSEEGKEIEGYDFKEVKGETEGIANTEEDIIIIYQYEKEPTKDQSNEITNEITNETTNEITNEIKNEITNEISNDIPNEKETSKVFDLEINKTIKKVFVKIDDNETEKKVKEGEKIYKVEVPAKKIKNTTIKVEYEIEVKNVGNVAGYAKKITDFIPEDMEYVETNDSHWKKEGDQITTEEMKDVQLNPGDNIKIPVTLELKLNGKNAGIKRNDAEITYYYNKEGLKDATPDNKSSSSLVVSVATGVLTYTFEIIGAILIFTGIAIIISNKKKQK